MIRDASNTKIQAHIQSQKSYESITYGKIILGCDRIFYTYHLRLRMKEKMKKTDFRTLQYGMGVADCFHFGRICVEIWLPNSNVISSFYQVEWLQMESRTRLNALRI